MTYKVSVHFTDDEGSMYHTTRQVEAQDEIDAEMIAEEEVLRENGEGAISVTHVAAI